MGLLYTTKEVPSKYGGTKKIYIPNIKGIVLSVLAFFALMWLVAAIDIVQTGKTQVVTRFGKVVRTNGEGLAFHWPLVERTKSIDTTIRRESADAVVATSNLQQVTVSAAINYRISRENAVKQYQNFTKADFVQIIVQPKIQDGIKAVTPEYTAETLVLKREEVAKAIKQKLQESLGEYGIDVVDVSIANYQFGPDYTKAVADKSVIVQQIEAAKLNTQNIQIASDNAILQAKQNAIAQIEKARGDAEAQRLQQTTLTALIVQQQAIAKWNGTLPTTVAGEGTIFSIPVK
jgi:prohibitin 1